MTWCAAGTCAPSARSARRGPAARGDAAWRPWAKSPPPGLTLQGSGQSGEKCEAERPGGAGRSGVTGGWRGGASATRRHRCCTWGSRGASRQNLGRGRSGRGEAGTKAPQRARLVSARAKQRGLRLQTGLLRVGREELPSLCRSRGLCASPHPGRTLPVTRPSTRPPLLQLPHTVLPSLLYLGRVCLLLRPAGFLPGDRWAWSSASPPSGRALKSKKLHLKTPPPGGLQALVPPEG